jgi:predicted Zn-ribbon and HTH transcriptional regulator
MPNPDAVRENGTPVGGSGTKAATALVMPQCPKCGWHDVRPSMMRTALDRALSTFSLAPFRCRTCRHRFYRFFKRASAS